MPLIPKGGVPIKGQYPIKGQSKFVFSIFFDFFGNADTLFLGDFGAEGGAGGKVFLSFRNEIYLFLFDHIYIFFCCTFELLLFLLKKQVCHLLF